MFARLVEAETLAMNSEQTFRGLPILALAAHALSEDGGIEFSVAGFADSIHYAVCFSRQFFSQTLFKIRRDAAGQSKHVDECLFRSRFFRPFQQHWNVGR